MITYTGQDDRRHDDARLALLEARIKTLSDRMLAILKAVDTHETVEARMVSYIFVAVCLMVLSTWLGYPVNRAIEAAIAEASEPEALRYLMMAIGTGVIVWLRRLLFTGYKASFREQLRKAEEDADD